MELALVLALAVFLTVNTLVVALCRAAAAGDRTAAAMRRRVVRRRRQLARRPGCIAERDRTTPRDHAL